MSPLLVRGRPECSYILPGFNLKAWLEAAALCSVGRRKRCPLLRGGLVLKMPYDPGGEPELSSPSQHPDYVY